MPTGRGGEGKKNSEAAASSPLQGEHVAETQHRQRRFAALHKFQLRPAAAALYVVLREAMPCAFLDVSSLNLAAFSAANFLRTRQRHASPNLSGNSHPDVIPGFLSPQGSLFPRGNGQHRHTNPSRQTQEEAPFWRGCADVGASQNRWSTTSMTTPTM